MARKNSVKTYVVDAYYHIYNRGVGKQDIFLDTSDYNKFQHYLDSYLSPPPDKSRLEKTFTLKDAVFKGVPRQPKNYHKKINLIAYCLMPNHFHLLLQQRSVVSMKEFLHSLSIRYAMYFNKKYKRFGPLFQGRYKACLVNDDRYLLHLSRYIHLNPSRYTKDIVKAYSSYASYVGSKDISWIKPSIVLRFFGRKTNTIPEISKINSYKDFVEGYKGDSSIVLGSLTLD